MKRLHAHQAAALPNAQNGPVLAYLGQSKPAPVELRDAVVAVVKELRKKDQAESSTVTAYSSVHFASHGAASLRAYEALLEALDYPADASIVCTQIAMQHCDEDFAGVAFVSKVLHTGGHPYHFRASERAGTRQRPRTDAYGAMENVVTQGRYLDVDDLLVFDPLHLHSAMPGRLDPDAFLILLQHEAEIETVAQRYALLRRWPRHPFDRDEEHTERAMQQHNRPSENCTRHQSRENVERMFLASLSHQEEMHIRIHASSKKTASIKFDPAVAWERFLSDLVGKGHVQPDAFEWEKPAPVVA